MSHFFAYISKMKWIKRWGLMKNTADENIMEHSWQVAVIAHGLAVIRNTVFPEDGLIDECDLTLCAIYHETGEVITGDLATPVKYYNPQVKNAFKDLDLIAREKIFGMLPEELQPAYRPLIFPDTETEMYSLLKAADKICAYLKCVEELKWGNKEFAKAAVTIKNELESLPQKEVQYFMENFVDSFSLTLDELN